MTATIIIRSTGTGWEWLDLSEADARVQSGLPQLESAGNSHSGTACILLLPAEQVFLGSVNIATRNHRQLMQAVPFAVEEQLAEDPESLHYAVHRTGAENLVKVAAVSRADLQQSLDELQKNNLVAERLVPDALLLPWHAGEVSVLIDNDRALVRYGDNAASAIETELLDPWLSLLIEGLDPKPEKIVLFGSEDAASPVNWPLPCENRSNKGGVLALLANGLPGSPVNLLQGEFTPHLQQSQKTLWKGPAIAAGAAAVLAMTVNFAELHTLKASSSRLEQSIETRFRQSFPQVQRLQDPVIQANRELQRLRGGSASADSDFLLLLGGVAASISAEPDLKLKNLSYRNGQMQLELDATSIDQLEQLEQAAEQAGLIAKLQSARLGADGVSGTLILTRTQS